MNKKPAPLTYRLLSAFIAFTFSFTSVVPPSYAQSIAGLNLPVPGAMVPLSPAFVPVLLKGMTIHPDNPLQLDFIIDSGNTNFKEDQIKAESQRLVKYFLASMTIPKDDLWVNLSPYEKDRIIPDELGRTELGRDMLAQDYILKQLTASLMYPEKELGKVFWDKVYQKAKEKFGTTEIPVDTFNKVWILPETATVYEHGQTVYIVEAKLRVMLDSDYVAQNLDSRSSILDSRGASSNEHPATSIESSIIKEVILPAIEKEVNEGQNFAPLRQIYHSLILAKWYKETIKNSLLSKIYVDQKKIAGVNLDDATLKDQIYAQYMEAYKKGVFNYIKEDYDQFSTQPIPRKYFSGGIDRLTNFKMVKLQRIDDPLRVESARVGQHFALTTRVNPQKDGEALSKESSSPITPQEAEAMIRGKLAAEYHHLINDIHVQLAMAHEGNFDVVYHAFAPEKIEIIRAKAVSQSSSPLSEQELENLFNKGSLDEFSRAYWKALKSRYDRGGNVEKLMIDDNFYPSALLTKEQRQELLGAIDYKDLVSEVEGSTAETIKAYDIVMTPLDAGLGTNVGRGKYVKEHAADLGGRETLGAKGTDLGFRVTIGGIERFVSIAEMKLLRLIKEKERNNYKGKIIFQPIVSQIDGQERTTYNELFERPNLEDFKQGRSADNAAKYQDALGENGFVVDAKKFRVVKDYPSLDAKTKEPTYERKASGSHGEWGFKFFKEAVAYTPNPERPQMIAFYNGDGTNNTPTHYITEWMQINNVPIVMVSTEKTGIDKKGGQIGVKWDKTEKAKNNKKGVSIRMLELASAKSNGQKDPFVAMGLTKGEKGQQYFNTNIAVINYDLMARILKKLNSKIPDNELNDILTPDLIASVKPQGGKDYIQLEGAIGTVFLRIHNYFESGSEEVKGIFKEILEEDRQEIGENAKEVSKILRIVNVSAKDRTQFFTPVKEASDFWFQAHTDYYKVNTDTWMLEDTNLDTDNVPPEFDLEHIMPDKTNYYTDVTNLNDSFGSMASVVGLDSLRVRGPVQLSGPGQNGPILKGNVNIENESGQRFDLWEYANSRSWPKMFHKNPDGRLVLENVDVKINNTGVVSVSRHVVFIKNTLIAELVHRDKQESELMPEDVDVLMIPGNDELAVYEKVLDLFSKGIGRYIAISGGTGRLTEDIKKVADANGFSVAMASEAEMIRSILIQMAQRNPQWSGLVEKLQNDAIVLLEKGARYTVENFTKTEALLRNKGLLAQGKTLKILYIPKTLQQLRTNGQFNSVFADQIARGEIQGISFAADYHPEESALAEIVAEMFRIIANAQKIDSRTQRRDWEFEGGLGSISKENWVNAKTLFDSLSAAQQQELVITMRTNARNMGVDNRGVLYAGLPEHIKIFAEAIFDYRSSPSDTPQASSPVIEQQGTGDRVKGTKISNDERRDTSDEVGGIDMNTIDLERLPAGRQGEGGEVDIQFDPTELQEIIDAGIDGFAPVIINITPLPSVLPLLGLEPQRKEEESEVYRLN